MLFKTTTKNFLILSSIEIITLFLALTPISKAQNIFASTPISQESVNAATDLSQQGQAKAKQLNYRGAIADLSKAIQLNPNEADFYYQRGVILGKLSDRQSAVQDFDDAILRDPNHAWAYLQRAGMSFNLGSSFQINDYRGFSYRLGNLTGDRRGDARAMLDLRTARDLFAQQGNQEGLETADLLIQHFAGDLESETNQKS